MIIYIYEGLACVSVLLDYFFDERCQTCVVVIVDGNLKMANMLHLPSILSLTRFLLHRFCQSFFEFICPIMMRANRIQALYFQQPMKNCFVRHAIFIPY